MEIGLMGYCELNVMPQEGAPCETKKGSPENPNFKISSGYKSVLKLAEQPSAVF